ncbi:MAG: hypothetical protein ACR2NU_01760 [Aeoliella sp.]
MTPEYQRIRQATPHIKYKSSFLVLLLVRLLIVFAIITSVLLISG